MKSIFLDKNTTPSTNDLEHGLGETYPIWESFIAFTLANYPGATCEWNFSGEKFGWSFRVKDHKRVLIYLLPRDKYFKAAFVFGQKAVNQILGTDISASIQTALQEAKPYAEGRGIRIDIKDPSDAEDILKLIKIKLCLS